MKRLIPAAFAVLLGLAASSAQAGLLCGCNQCICPPAPDCPDCSSPCDHFRLPSLFGAEHAQKLICTLTSGDCCERLKAAKSLGCRMHADYACNPEVLAALIHALQCDTCWEVRKAAAWAILGQNARVPQGVVALYLAAKIDPHYMVRSDAAEALDILIRCRKGCYKEMFAAADELAKSIKGYSKPTDGRCVNLLNEFCASFNSQNGAIPIEGTPVMTAPPGKVEVAPAPQPEPGVAK
jgi:hypothetical protein